MIVRYLLAVLAVCIFVFPCCSGETTQQNPDAADGADNDAQNGDDGGTEPDLDVSDGDHDPADGDLEQSDGDQPTADGDLEAADGDQETADGDQETSDGDSQPADGDSDPCSSSGIFDYSCEAGNPDTCPGGMCVLGLCIGPVLDPDRWADCGDDSCGQCETEELCPADCGQPPEMSGEKEYDNDTTITVGVHGFYNKSPDELAQKIYGEAESCSGLIGDIEDYGITDLPCGNTPDGRLAPNQRVAVEYYGGVPADWLTQEQIDEIEQYPYEGTGALQRYGLIVAKFIRHRLDISGATHVNLACHSMGCLIIRHMIENNLEGLAAENRFVRWFTSAGVLAGAQLARLYDNPTIRDGAQLLGMELNDFVIMHPDFVQDITTVWDHKLHAGNNPLLAGMLIHNACACDPHIAEAIGIALLDLNNPDDEPNDGIMYTADEYFHSQNPEASFVTPNQEVLAATHSLVYVDHMTLPNSDAAALKATATLFHSRKVFITLDEIELLNDRENHEPFDGEQGDPPAEIIAQSQIRYNPYILNTFGKDILVHDDQLEYRTSEMFTQDQGTTLQPGLTIFEGPIFDEMDALSLDLLILEVDWYPRRNVHEYILDYHEGLIEFHGQIQLSDNVIELENEFVKVWLKVDVVQLY
jgi:hypothetical protein